jgi:hypothetical protein
MKKFGISKRDDEYSEVDLSKIYPIKPKLEEMEVTMENGILPVLGVFCTAVILLAATINYSSSMTLSMLNYAKSLASISMIISFVLLARIKQLRAASIFIRYFLFLWSFVGGCVLTFGFGPFAHTGNGYFCVWGMTIFSFLSLVISHDSVKNAIAAHISPLATLGFLSFIVFLAAVPFLGSNYHWESIFALVVSLITIVIVGIYVYKYQQNSELPDSAFYALLFLAIVWIFTAGITTFRGPFLVTGNGYFAVWGGAVVGIVATKQAHPDEPIVETPARQRVSTSPSPSPRGLHSPDDVTNDGTASKTAMLTTV